MSDPLSSLISGGFNLAGQALNYKYQKKLMDKQYKLNLQGLEESPLSIRKGLERAGYNPIYYSGQTNAQASVGSAPSPPSSTLGTDIVNAYQQNKLNDANVEATNAQAELSNQQAKTEEAKRINMEFQNRMLDVEQHLKQKDLDSYDRRVYSELYEQMQRAENFRAMANLQGYNAESQRIASNAQMINAQTNRELGKYEKDRQRLEAQWRSRHPMQSNWLSGISNYASAFGGIFKKR